MCRALLVTKQSLGSSVKIAYISGALADRYDMGFVANETIQCYERIEKPPYNHHKFR